ncbi:NAD kinase [Chlamydiales bacterium STE3]|nr:NAD kinase [Chlamydiales bacterium STE3]
MIVALFPNLTKTHTIKVALEIVDFFHSRGVQVVTEDEKAEELSLQPLSKVDPNDIKFLISLGGDGTILRIVHRNPELNAPLIGINMGGLGFMADVPLDTLYPSLEALLAGHYTWQDRLVIQGQIANETSFAINDIVIHRGKNPSLIDLLIHIDGCYLNTFSADGLIISTPNGSTAYSLAAGGPILTPDLDAIVITPISPHTISNRPIVIKADKEIQIQLVSFQEAVDVNYDGIVHQHLLKDDILRINPSDRKFRLIGLEKHFFATLRSKLGWSGKLKTYLSNLEKNP